MLRFTTESRSANGRLSRRDVLRLGGLAGLHLLAGRANAATRPATTATPGHGRARSVLVIYTSGGMSQLETWDPKPDAPEEIRGAFRAIRTSVPGTIFGEHLPRVARVADRFAVVRSMSHEDTDHGSATYLTMTGHYHARKSSNPLPRPSDLPTTGAIVHRVRPARGLPCSAVHVNGPLLSPEVPAPGQFAGLLGRSCEPLLLGDVADERPLVPGLEPLPELPTVRLARRRSLLDAIDGFRADAAGNRALLDMSESYRAAYAFLGSAAGRRAFDLSHEPTAVRERYGMYRTGQACLLARRLVEAGVPYINVFFNHLIRGQDRDPLDTELYGWDTHNDIFEALEHHLLPRFDQSFAALLTDLAERGLLGQTLVVCMGEFGRAPLVALEPRFAGASPGRKHWAAGYSIVMAGAGVTAGGLIGASDRFAAYPRTRPLGPWDVTATMFDALGIDPGGHYRDSENRPYTICDGTPIREIYG
ncbi:MAG: DUF1501 domain-containing protein [Gemmataceae bacterium]|nr:DUF1501 domain-containing protein [Gemmataceae bacterium]